MQTCGLRAVSRGEATPPTALPDGRIVAGGADGTVRVWNAEAGAQTLVLRGHEGGRGVQSVAALPDGRIVSGGSYGMIRIWVSETGMELTTIRSHDGPVRSVAALPDGRIISGGTDHPLFGSLDDQNNGGDTVRVWHIETPAEPLVLGHKSFVQSVAALPDGRIVSGDEDGVVRVSAGLTLSGNALQVACRTLPMTASGQDLAVGNLARHIHIPELPPLTPCDDYHPPLQRPWQSR